MQRQASPSQCGERLTTKDTKSTKKRNLTAKSWEDKKFRSGRVVSQNHEIQEVGNKIETFVSLTCNCAHVKIFTKDTKGFRIFRTPYLVIFVSFVVKISVAFWLRLCRAGIFVVNDITLSIQGTHRKP